MSESEYFVNQIKKYLTYMRSAMCTVCLPTFDIL